jgi:hypothetical protein
MGFISKLTQLYKKLARSAAIVLAAVLFAGGCHQFRVDSYPEGARIIVDGQDTGEVTPRVFSPRHFSTGMHKVTVEKQGYYTLTTPQIFLINVSAADIIFSLAPPILLKNIFHNHWKNERGKIRIFHLKENEGAVEAAQPPEVPQPAVKEGPIPARLKQLDRLRSQGLITEDEYAAKRKAILDTI